MFKYRISSLSGAVFIIGYDDLVTRKRLSQKSCAHMYLVLNDPPILNLPLDKDKVLENDFTNIVFRWTPRQVNALNVSYTFEIKELRDFNLSGVFTFKNGLPVYSESGIRSITKYLGFISNKNAITPVFLKKFNSVLFLRF
ncbi:hypothetical protein HX038_15365 [Myroides odoratimimus]|uniref:hypothetical protein n=1 Tax=Myroides odoratimimus TaxID=76832 RepID=UPI002576DFB7|nr:hypothetical protein [Myroides odoratimimus]MDM1412114.1 hypothetical protein [Myroides odoratimimus]